MPALPLATAEWPGEEIVQAQEQKITETHDSDAKETKERHDPGARAVVAIWIGGRKSHHKERETLVVRGGYWPISGPKGREMDPPAMLGVGLS